MLDLESISAAGRRSATCCTGTAGRPTGATGTSLRACYHDDAYDDHGSLVGPIDEFIRISKPFADRVAATMHFMGNALIELDGDVARVESYVIAYHVIEADDGTVQARQLGHPLRRPLRAQRRRVADRASRRRPRAADRARHPRGEGPALDARVLGIARRDRSDPLDPRGPPTRDAGLTGRLDGRTCPAFGVVTPPHGLPVGVPSGSEVSTARSRGVRGGPECPLATCDKERTMPVFSTQKRSRRGASIAILAAAAASLLGAACSDDSEEGSTDAATEESTAGSAAGATDAASDEPFRILYVGPLSGPLSVVGTSEVAGFNAAIDVVNADGGILGHPVELTTLDDAGDGTTGISLLEEELGSGTEYHLISAGAGAYDAVAMAPAIADEPVLQIPLAGEQVLNDPDAYPNLYVPSGGFGPQTLGIMERLDEEGISSVAIMYGDNVPEGGERLEEAAEEVGIDVTASVGVPAAATDATPQFQQAIDSDPGAIAISGFSPALVPILKARTTLGSDIPVYLDPFAGAANLGPSTTVEDRSGVLVETFPFLVEGDPAQDDETWQAFEAGVAEYLPEPLISLYAPLIAWDAVMMARAAAESAGTISGQAVPDALEQISDAADVPGFLGGEELYTPDDHMWQLAAVGLRVLRSRSARRRPAGPRVRVLNQAGVAADRRPPLLEGVTKPRSCADPPPWRGSGASSRSWHAFVAQRKAGMTHGRTRSRLSTATSTGMSAHRTRKMR